MRKFGSETDERGHRLGRYSPEITLGSILTWFGMAGSVIGVTVYVTDIKADVGVNRTDIANLKAQAAAKDQADATARQDLVNRLQYIQARVDEIASRDRRGGTP